jgi:hypothetical protein
MVHNVEEDQVERVTELLVAACPAQHTPQHIREVHVLWKTAIIMARGKRQVGKNQMPRTARKCEILNNLLKMLESRDCGSGISDLNTILLYLYLSPD